MTLVKHVLHKPARAYPTINQPLPTGRRLGVLRLHLNPLHLLMLHLSPLHLWVSLLLLALLRQPLLMDHCLQLRVLVSLAPLQELLDHLLLYYLIMPRPL